MSKKQNTEQQQQLNLTGQFQIQPKTQTGKTFTEPSLTEQHHKESVDIHNIMLQHKKTGILNHTAQYQGEYSNMIDAPTFEQAQRLIADANSMFETVPSHIRADFDNDPGKFLGFMQNPENREKIEAFGLDTTHLPELAPESAPQAPLEPPERTYTQSEVTALLGNKTAQNAGEGE